MKKYEFMYRLDRAISQLPEAERTDILNDYEEHFRVGQEKGKSEEEICENLGEPEELAGSYFEGVEGKKESTLHTVQQPPQANTNPPQGSNDSSNALGIVAIVVLAIFVFVPVIATLFGIWIGIAGTAFGMLVAGISVMVSAFLLNSIGLIFAMILLGIAFICIAILLVYAVVYGGKGIWKLSKLFIEVCNNIVK